MLNSFVICSRLEKDLPNDGN